MPSITFAAHAPAKFIGFYAFGPTDGLIPSDHRFWTAKFIADGAARPTERGDSGKTLRGFPAPGSRDGYGGVFPQP